MAYREVAMWEILEVLRRMGRGETQASVSRMTGHTRKTIRRYLVTAAELGWEPGHEEPTEALAAAVYARHRPASDREPGEAEARLLPHREQIRTWLTPGPGEKRGLRLTNVRGPGSGAGRRSRLEGRRPGTPAGQRDLYLERSRFRVSRCRGPLVSSNVEACHPLICVLFRGATYRWSSGKRSPSRPLAAWATPRRAVSRRKARKPFSLRSGLRSVRPAGTPRTRK